MGLGFPAWETSLVKTILPIFICAALLLNWRPYSFNFCIITGPSYRHPGATKTTTFTASLMQILRPGKTFTAFCLKWSHRIYHSLRKYGLNLKVALKEIDKHIKISSQYFHMEFKSQTDQTKLKLDLAPKNCQLIHVSALDRFSLNPFWDNCLKKVQELRQLPLKL